MGVFGGATSSAFFGRHDSACFKLLKWSKSNALKFGAEEGNCQNTIIDDKDYRFKGLYLSI